MARRPAFGPKRFKTSLAKTDFLIRKQGRGFQPQITGAPIGTESRVQTPPEDLALDPPYETPDKELKQDGEWKDADLTTQILSSNFAALLESVQYDMTILLLLKT
jgi:hypothetical protein